MKIKEGLVLRQVADIHVVLPIGRSCLNFDGMIRLNQTGVMLWNMMMERDMTSEELADGLAAKFDVPREEALRDVKEYIDILMQAGCIE